MIRKDTMAGEPYFKNRSSGATSSRSRMLPIIMRLADNKTQILQAQHRNICKWNSSRSEL